MKRLADAGYPAIAKYSNMVDISVKIAKWEEDAFLLKINDRDIISGQNSWLKTMNWK